MVFMKKNSIAGVLIFVAATAVGYATGVWRGTGDTGTAAQLAQLFAQKYDRPVESIIIGINEDTGMFAKGSVQYEGQFGGGLWFAAKTDKGWEIAFDGNGIMPCSAANGYDFPASMVPHCVDTEHGNELASR